MTQLDCLPDLGSAESKGPPSDTTQDRKWTKDNETKKHPVPIYRGITLLDKKESYGRDGK